MKCTPDYNCTVYCLKLYRHCKVVDIGIVCLRVHLMWGHCLCDGVERWLRQNEENIAKQGMESSELFYSSAHCTE